MHFDSIKISKSSHHSLLSLFSTMLGSSSRIIVRISPGQQRWRQLQRHPWRMKWLNIRYAITNPMRLGTFPFALFPNVNFFMRNSEYESFFFWKISFIDTAWHIPIIQISRPRDDVFVRMSPGRAILTRISSWHSRMIALPSLHWTRRFRISVIICYVMLNAQPCCIRHLKLRLCGYILNKNGLILFLFVCGCDMVRFIIRSTVFCFHSNGILIVYVWAKKCNRMNGMFIRMWMRFDIIVFC